MNLTTRAISILFITILVSGLAAGQANATTQEHDGPGPGGITPDSALYGLEVAMDNAGMTLGLSSPGTVAQERAAEAQAMQRQNKTRAMQRAANEMSKVAERAGSRDTEKLQKASDVLQGVINRAPAEAQDGLQEALSNVQNRTMAVGGTPGGMMPDDVGPNGSTDRPNGTTSPDGPVSGR